VNENSGWGPYGSLRGLYAVSDISRFKPQPSFNFGTPCGSMALCRGKDTRRIGTISNSAQRPRASGDVKDNKLWRFHRQAQGQLFVGRTY
jgi:hypothetical protein